jgi:hypothetical protein
MVQDLMITAINRCYPFSIEYLQGELDQFPIQSSSNLVEELLSQSTKEAEEVDGAEQNNQFHERQTLHRTDQFAH